MNGRTALAVVSLVLAPPALAQQVSRLEIARGPMEAEPRTSIDIYVPADLSSLDFSNPVDGSGTQLVAARDDAGRDLLAAHDAVNARWVEQGYEIEAPVSFAGVADPANDRGVNIGVVLKAAPSPGAKAIEVEGVVALNFIDVAGMHKTVLTAIPMESAAGSPGVGTPIGTVRIEPASSMVADGVRYQGYLVVSPDAPIIAVAVVGGDASDEANGMGMGLERGMFVIKGDPPPKVDLEVTYASRETRRFPFKLSFGVGF